MRYNITIVNQLTTEYHKKEDKTMSGKKKNRNQNDPSKVIILITVIIQLVTALITLISKLTE